MSRKKAPPRPESGFVSRDPAHFPYASASLEQFCLFILLKFLLVPVMTPSSLRERQAMMVKCVNHGSIRGSRPMAISGCPRGHNVKWVTRCQGTHGQISLTDTPLEPSISEPDRPHRREIPRDGKASCSAMLKLAVAIVVGRSLLLSSTWLR